MTLERALMSFWLPPYRKLHIIIFGSLALIGYLLVILFSSVPTTTSNKTAKAIITSGSGLKHDFAKPLELAQAGNFDTAMVNDKFLIIDIRSVSDYDHAHIEGALSTPINQLADAQFLAGTQIVLYGRLPDDISKALTILGDEGFTEVRVLNDSLMSLEKTGYTITKHP